jgi:hypothetical protein
VPDDVIGHESGHDRNIIDTGASERPELAIEERLSGNAEKALGSFCCKRTEPSSAAGGEQDCVADLDRVPPCVWLRRTAIVAKTGVRVQFFSVVVREFGAKKLYSDPCFLRIRST